ncbi:DUF2264 domain-containing protein [Flexithrix dorotheae]|uniref:DUF2264 domain-containing protein n=1 Tax=Flexithrix dorotheae TaxID=70993 RepID=UPI00037E44C4|nr:DUF2264 domain-containing protein [Flexithrix dorotheae]
MIRRNFIKGVSLAGLGNFLPKIGNGQNSDSKAKEDREFWVTTTERISRPVLEALSQGKLKALMPVEAKEGHRTNRGEVTYLEAFGRLLAGVAPWLERGEGTDAEGKLRKEFIDLTLKSLGHAVNPKSPDFMNFTKGGQPVVDAAFLCHGLLRAPQQLLGKLEEADKINLINALKSSRVITPYYNNWLLFSAMVEACLLEITGECDMMRVDYAVKKHLEWYLGDGVYGDGEEFHWDYYNSYVIQPMLLDILFILNKHEKRNGDKYDLVLKRAIRYAAIQERLISPEGTFPPIGRSLPYRFGAFQVLAQMALMKKLPEGVSPAQVRCGLTAVIKRMIEANGTFDNKGWLTIGFCGHQPDIAETYLSTGSMYLCSVGLLPLGLQPNDEFWTSPAKDWTAKKIWSGENLPNDKALK